MNKEIKNPIQPLTMVENVLRFKENEIVRYLLDNGNLSLNDLALKEFNQNDWEQFYQLIGYSLSGFSELSQVSNDTYETACLMHENGLSDLESENMVLKERLIETRKLVKQLTTILFNIHPDDLSE